ncbi:S1C family serine protease [Lentzea albidocapillata]|uniref:Serine protease, S1-C subfamily, contains C-terminal PDZ domain n=1 Tax=Lentzea albidocapillata TaxID=40571 RepID=A0A1W2FRW1_9PSEU|nr:trypsin-like peptidase domain-containing protein [Lentzea albidocapillata]SMD24671.1 serine protease, S1-C subfamily, contains C-terminal PDZ domain [Lentzea albidocapillata]
MRNDQFRQITVAFITVVAAVTLLLALVACSPGDTGTSAPMQRGGSSYADLVERVSPNVVTVRTEASVGSGVVFRSDIVLTNEHVVGGRDQVSVEYADGGRSGGTVLATDAITDLAVVRTERKDLPVAEFSKELPRPGDPVLAIGSPLGFENSVTAGIVSGLHREIPGSAAQTRSLVDLIQTDAPISPGNSGGALLDTSGKVIGINEAYIPSAAGAVSLGFAIPSATAVDIAEQLLENGTAEHPYLGISAGRLTDEIRERFGVRADTGVVVLGVDEKGPAADAGIRPGDVIVRLHDTEVRTVEALLGALRATDPGQQVTAMIVRNGDKQELRVEIASRSR